ncbi:MAG: hypothetical protein Q9167_006689 [Letrouitia subvulpina]
MSFGVAVGDFIAVGNLAWKVYRSCKGMKAEFEEVANEARAAHTVLKELEDEAKEERSTLNRHGAARKREFMTLIGGLHGALAELDKIVLKYQSLTRRERRIWDQLKLATEDLKSLERGILSRMEAVLLELVEEVRQGRRPPTLVSIDHLQDTSGWKELELELAEDGITGADVAEHKAAIRVFLLGRLKDSNTDDLSFHDVASAIESGDGHRSLARTLSDLSVTSEQRSITSTVSNSESFQTARENLEQEANPILSTSELRISFAPFTRIPPETPPDTSIFSGSAKRFGQFNLARSTSRNKDRYRRSVDYGRNHNLLGPKPEMILIIDPVHSSFSKLMHAYLRSLTKTQPLIRERIDTVRSTGWKSHESGGIDMFQIDEMIKDLLVKKGVEVPHLDTYYKIAEFYLGDVLQFDHIIYLDSPLFLQYLEDNVHQIAKTRVREGLEDRKTATLTKYDLPSSIQLPESMTEKRGLGPEIFRSRQKLALEEIFKAVQRFTNDFLEKEFEIRKSSQGFKKVVSKRPSSASLVTTIDRRKGSASTEAENFPTVTSISTTFTDDFYPD